MTKWLNINVNTCNCILLVTAEKKVIKLKLLMKMLMITKGVTSEYHLTHVRLIVLFSELQ